MNVIAILSNRVSVTILLKQAYHTWLQYDVFSQESIELDRHERFALGGLITQLEYEKISMARWPKTDK